MTVLELCAGYGGLGIAVGRLTGRHVSYVAESMPAPSRILAARYPSAPNIGDITTADWRPLRGQVTTITAGFPCQDISFNGKGLGLDGPRSGIWRHVVDAVRILRPTSVFLENVSAIRSRGLAGVLRDLATLRYDVRWTCVRASDVGAAHHRDRWFALAYPDIGPPTVDDYRFGWDGRTGQVPEWTPGPELAYGPHSPSWQWGEHAEAIRRHELMIGRPAPAATDTGPRGGHRMTPEYAEWFMGLPAGWITSVPGLTRGEMIRAAGNGVMPQQAYAAYASLVAGEWTP